MDSVQMDQLLMLQKTMNFKHAADELGISQPTLTYHIKKIEGEIGFRLFDRDGKTVSITPAGEQFCMAIRNIREDYRRAVENGQNISGKYRAAVRIGLPFRSAISRLPRAIREFYDSTIGISVVPDFHTYGDFSGFYSGLNDIEFMLRSEAEHMKDIDIHPLYSCGISLIVSRDDPLASRDSVSAKDLEWRTLMVGGASPPALQRVQQKVLSSGRVRSFNSADHDTTLTNVAVGSGVCLAPDFLMDENDGFVWVPFDCEEVFDCVLAVHRECDPAVRRFVEILQSQYAGG